MSEVKISTGQLILEGILDLPKNPKGLVLFAHGSGSGRDSPRNQYVAKVLQDGQIGTLLFDLLTEEEDSIYENRFNIELLTDRLIAATDWIKANPKTKNLSLGYFGASTGAAAALNAATQLPDRIHAVVSRGGRPDLAQDSLLKVQAPTLLIVGENDPQVLLLNQDAYQKLKGPKKLEIIPGATHLFEEAGTLEKVARLATQWFKKYLR